MSALLTIRQACAELAVSRATLENWEKSGLIHFSRIGRTVRIKRTELDRFIDSLDDGGE